MPTIDPRQKQEQNWKRRYGMTRRAYERLLAYQGGMCAACGGPPDTEDQILAIDHSHETGKVRGLLCKACNTALGNAKDDPAKLARLKLYLETHAPQPALPVPAGSTAQGPSEVVRAAAAVEPVLAPDPRIPTPEVIAALKGHGMTQTEIAEEFNLDRSTVRALYTESQRSSRVEAARDLLLEKALPHALVTITQAVQDGDAKTSVALVKGLGVLRDRAEPAKETRAGTVNFEQWRASLTVERFTAHLDPEADEQDTLDAEASLVLPDTAPPGPTQGAAGCRLPSDQREDARHAPAPEAPPRAGDDLRPLSRGSGPAGPAVN
jgi:hypothetical protein